MRSYIRGGATSCQRGVLGESRRKVKMGDEGAPLVGPRGLMVWVLQVPVHLVELHFICLLPSSCDQLVDYVEGSVLEHGLAAASAPPDNTCPGDPYFEKAAAVRDKIGE